MSPSSAVVPITMRNILALALTTGNAHQCFKLRAPMVVPRKHVIPATRRRIARIKGISMGTEGNPTLWSTVPNLYAKTIKFRTQSAIKGIHNLEREIKVVAERS